MKQDFSILDSLIESSAIIDNSGIILFVNRAWCLFSNENNGDGTKTDIGVNYLSVCDNVVGEESEITKNASTGIRNVITGVQKIFELEYPCHSPVEKRWFILRASRLSTNDKLILVMHINITKRKLAEIDLELNNEKMKVINDRLHSSIYKIVHDIQSPLNSIIGIIDLSKKDNDIQSIKKSMDLMNKSSINLKSFINETLNYISSTATYDFLDFNIFLQSQLELIDPLLQANSIEIKRDLGAKNKFYTNSVEFRSIFTNLLYNAIKYCDPEKNKKYINILLRIEEDRIILKIKDNGIGIKKEHLSQLFESNFQVNKAKSEGIGLGLYMVKKSVEALEGTITVTSDFKNETEFTVEIPNKKLIPDNFNK